MDDPELIGTGLPGLVMVETKGELVKVQDLEAALEAEGLHVHFKNRVAYSPLKDELTGLHIVPLETSYLLVRVISGVIFQVAADVRKGSPSFGLWYGTILTDENHRGLVIPGGFAQGYLTLTKDTRVDCFSTEDADMKVQGLYWNDPDLGIRWPLDRIGGSPKVSAEDNGLPPLSELELDVEFNSHGKK